MNTTTDSKEQILSMLRAEYPDIDDLALRINADVLAKGIPATAVVTRVLSSPADNPGRDQAQRLIGDVIRGTIAGYGVPVEDPERIYDFAVRDWESNRVQDFARMFAFGSTAQALGISERELCKDDRTTTWINNLLDEDYGSGNFYEDLYWRGVALLGYFVMKETGNSSFVFNGKAGEFMTWIKEDGNFEAIAPFFVERCTIDIDALTALRETSSSVPAPMLLGTL